MSVTWIMQQNLVSEPQKWIEALEAMGSKWKPITIIPFADSLEDVEVDGPALVYGSTTLIKNAHQKNWNPGVFFNPDNFRPSLWNEKYGQEMFNFDGEVYRVRDLHTFTGKDCFLRPNSDMKEFSGSRVDLDGLQKFYTEVMKGDFPFDGNTEVFLAPLKEIHREWRCFIVNGAVVASSQYRFRSLLLKSPDVPMKVKMYAAKMAHKWSPEKAYVMDICDDMDGNLKILELNCFNASGVYECDVKSIIRAVERMFDESN